jgi:hypothetical protein
MCPKGPAVMPRLPRIDSSWLFLVALVFSFALPSAVRAVPTITLGTYVLQPNTPNQTISIFVSGGDAVNGVTLDVTTGDGGVSGNFPAPVITGINLFPAGGVFTSSNSTPPSGYGQATGGQFYEASTTTNSGSVNLGTATTSSLLATITFTTAAFSYTYNSADPQEQSFSTPEYTSGSYSLSISGTMYDNGPTVYTDPTVFTPNTIGQPETTDGVIVVPEPGCLAFLAMALPAFFLRRPSRKGALRAVRSSVSLPS